MSSERNALPLGQLNDDEILPLENVAGAQNQALTGQQIDAVERTSIASGFPSRAARRRRPTKSPHTQQFTVRVQPKFAKAFRDFSDTNGIYDYATFERAIIALLEKNNCTEQLQRLRD